MSVLSELLAVDGFGWLVLGAFLAGIVRGFTGFGTAMVYLPIAGQFLSPAACLVTMIVMDLVGPLPAVPRALRDGHTRDVLRLGAGALIGAPIGLAILLMMQPDAFRTVVSVVSLVLLGLLLSGVRYSGTVTKPLIYATGALSGLFGGIAGLPGPPTILFYMARPLPPQVIRASLLLFLVLVDVLLLANLASRGMLTREPRLVGLLLTPPYTLAIVAGSWAFSPRHETLYRRAAYLVIAVSALKGLPIWPA